MNYADEDGYMTDFPMSSGEFYREAIREWARNVADPDPAKCACGGSGWMLHDFDVWERCPVSDHYSDEHPEM